MKARFLILIFAVCCLGAWSCPSSPSLGVTVEAQTLPVTKLLVWDPYPPTQMITSFTVTLDGTVIAQPTNFSNPGVNVTFTTAGAHTITVTAFNIWGGSSAAQLDVNVVLPSKPTGLKLQ